MSCFFFFKQKTAYEMRISDWSSDVCSSDLPGREHRPGFEKCPEGQREPHREIGDVGDQVVGEEMVEGLHGRRNLAPPPKSERAGRIAAPALFFRFAVRQNSLVTVALRRSCSPFPV